MAVFCQATAFGLLLTAAGLFTLGSTATGRSNGGTTKISAKGTINLGQERDAWMPVMYSTVNLSEISSIKSTFQLRTFDPEGTVFYGDTKDGEDWFVLSLQDGLPLMQISKAKIHVSAAGGPKLNDGEWHTLEVSNHGRFVVLEVDGSKGLVLGMESMEDDVLSGALRLAVGGILINNNKMIVQYSHHLDGCVRQGNWLNISLPWVSEAQELWPCYQDVQPGSYFVGAGFAVFNTSMFPLGDDDEISIELWGNFSKMDGTILSIKPLGQERMFSLVANNETKELTLSFGSETIIMENMVNRLNIIIRNNSLGLHKYEDSFKGSFSIFPMSNSDHSTVWKKGHLAFGGLLGEGEDQAGSNFLKGCLEKIQIQGKNVDLDLAFKYHMSISSHSCPV